MTRDSWLMELAAAAAASEPVPCRCQMRLCWCGQCNWLPRCLVAQLPGLLPGTVARAANEAAEQVCAPAFRLHAARLLWLCTDNTDRHSSLPERGSPHFAKRARPHLLGQPAARLDTLLTFARNVRDRDGNRVRQTKRER